MSKECKDMLSIRLMPGSEKPRKKRLVETYNELNFLKGGKKLKIKSFILAGAALAAITAFSAQAADTIKIAFIDPLSGPFAATGTSGYKQYQWAAEKLVNEKGGVLGGRMFEIVPFDNKISPKESLVQLKRAIGEGITFIAQGNSSSVANALTDAVKKHNDRNPDNRVVFMNY